METIRSFYNSIADFCSRVIQWRSTATVPYIFAVNTTFWAMVYYATTETQMKSLAALAIIIFCNDVMFSPTNERSVIVQILMWPIRDFWKTLAVALCGAGIHQLGEENKEEALWFSYGAIVCLLISPVYKYNEVNQKIVDTFCSVGSFVKGVLTYCIVRPILYVYEGLKYVFLLKWLPGLANWLRSSREAMYNSLDRIVLQRIRAFGQKCADFFRYWFYFHWVTDLKAVLYAHIGEPILQRLRVVRDYFVYVFGGYWFAPMCRSAGRATYTLSCHMMAAANKCAIAIGNSVVWPLVVLAYEQLKQLGYIAYDTAGRPVVNALHQKYKVVEDTAYIYILGPSVKTLIECVPEKNPFERDSDSELDEFLPGPVGDATEVEPVEMRDETENDQLEEIRDDDLDDLDDDRFLVKRLQHDFSGTDSSDEEFLIFPKTQRRT